MVSDRKVFQNTLPDCTTVALCTVTKSLEGSGATEGDLGGGGILKETWGEEV